MEKIKNIGAPAEFSLSWGDGKSSETLESLCKHVVSSAKRSSDWYNSKKPPKSFFARWLRVPVILLIAAAQIIPAISQLYTENGKPCIQPGWATVSLLVAATLVTLDKFFGFTSGWMRFVKTEQQISHLIGIFQVEWERIKSKWIYNNPSGEPDKSQLEEAIKTLKDFVSNYQDIVKDETDMWILEFKSAISQIDDAAKVKQTAPAPASQPTTPKQP